MAIEIRGMPWQVRLFLGYAFVILAAIGLSLRWVVDQAIATPVSPIGLVVMCLLAYTIFTTTLVLQRKAASRTLAVGLATLTVPAIPLAAIVGLWPAALFCLALAILLLRGLRAPVVARWLSEP